MNEKKEFAVRVEEVHSKTFIVEAASLEEAVKKVELHNETEGFSLEEITDFRITPALVLEEDLKYCDRL